MTGRRITVILKSTKNSQHGGPHNDNFLLIKNVITQLTNTKRTGVWTHFGDLIFFKSEMNMIIPIMGCKLPGIRLLEDKEYANPEISEHW